MSITSALNMLDLVSLKQLCTLVCSIPHWVLNDISLHSKPFPFTAVVKYLVTGPWSHSRQAILEDGRPVFWKLSVSPSFTAYFVNPFHPDTTKCLADISLSVEASRLYVQRKQSLLGLIPEQMCVWHAHACVYISYWQQDYNMCLGEPIWT